MNTSFTSIVAAIALCASTAFAGQKDVYGTVQPTGQLHLLSNSGPETQDASYPAVLYSIPRFDGRDAAGTFIGFNRLVEVRVTTSFTMKSLQAGENRTGNTLGLWNAEAGLETYFGSAPSFESQLPVGTFFGGDSYVGHSISGLTLAAFDGAVDGSGGSGYYRELTSTPFMTVRKLVGANDNRELRRWCGQGNLELFCMPRAKRGDTGWKGHWDRWDALWVEARDIGWAQGFQIQVSYVYSDGPVTARERVIDTPWQELPSYFMTAENSTPPPFVSSLPAFQGDPQRLVRVYTEYAYNAVFSQGIENIGSFAAICGGSAYASFGVRVPGYPTLMGNGASVGLGSGGFPIQPWDGSTDFAGTSGFGSWGSPWFTNVYRKSSTDPSWSGPPTAAWVQPQTIELVTSGAYFQPQPVTPGGTFAWWANARVVHRTRNVFVERQL